MHSNYVPGAPGGVETVVAQLLDVLRERGYRLRCVCASEEASGKLLQRGIPVWFRKVLCRLGRAPLLSWGNAALLRRVAGCDLLIFQEPYPSLWPALWWLQRVRGLPVIVLVHANPAAWGPVQWLYHRLRGLVLRGATCVATSPRVRDQMTNEGFAGTQMIPLGIPDALVPADHRLALPERFVLYFGRLAAYKGLPILLDAIGRLARVNFVIAGAGPLARRVRRFRASHSGESLWFLDRHLDEAEKLELFARCAFVVFPSTTRNEAFGIVQLEAMRHGKAIVNTWLDSGVNYVAPNEDCAVTVEAGNASALAEAIHMLWEHPARAGELGRAGRRRYVQCFTLDRFQHAWVDLVGRTLGVGLSDNDAVPPCPDGGEVRRVAGHS